MALQWLQVEGKPVMNIEALFFSSVLIGSPILEQARGEDRLRRICIRRPQLAQLAVVSRRVAMGFILRRTGRADISQSVNRETCRRLCAYTTSRMRFALN